MKTVGSRAEVWNGTAKKTSGGLLKKDLKKNKRGRIVSKKMSNRAKKEKRLEKAGYKTKKGKFTLFKAKKKGGMNGNNKETNKARGLAAEMFKKANNKYNTNNSLIGKADGHVKLFEILKTYRSRKSSSIDPLEELIKKGVNINARDRFGRTPLSFLLRHSDTFINPIKILLKAGADPNIKQKDGDTPLLVWMKHRPSKEKSLYAVELLLKAGADPNIPDKDGNTALHLMKDWHWSRTGLFDLLIDFGADITTENNEGETPLQVAEKQYERIREPKSLRKLRALLRNPRAHKAKPIFSSFAASVRSNTGLAL